MRQSDNMNQGTNGLTNGLTSVTSMLKQIYDETVSGNKILESIEIKFDEYFSYTQLSVGGILNNQVLLNNIQVRQTSLLNSINIGIITMTNMLQEVLDVFGVNKKFIDTAIKNSSTTQKMQSTVEPQGVSIDVDPLLTVVTDIKNLLMEQFRKKVYSSGEVSSNGNDAAQQSTTENMKSMFSKVVNDIVPNVMNSAFVTNNMLMVFENIHQTLLNTNNLLEQILSSLQSIYLYLPNLNNTSEGGMTKTVKSRANEFKKLVDSFAGFKNILTKNFLKDFETFVNLYEKFIDEKFTKRLISLTFNFSKFTVVMNIIGETLNSVKNVFNALTLSIWMLTISLLLPPFQLGFAYLLGILKAMKTTLGGGKDMLIMIISMRKLALSIVFMVGAVYLMGKIDFGNVVKLLVFLTALAGVLRLFQKKSQGVVTKNVNVSKKFGISGIFSAAVGIAILVFSIDLATQTDYNKSAALIVFIFGLGLTLWAFNRGKIGKDGPLNSLMSISVGLSILLLVVDAISEVNWQSAILIYGFIFTLGLTIAIANRLMGNKKASGKFSLSVGMRMGGIFGFAAGLALLILAIDAANELSWRGATQLILFVTGITLVLALASKISGGKGMKMSGMFGFAAGVGLLVLAVAACKEVDFGPGWELIGLVAVLVGVLALSQRIIGKPKAIGLQVSLFAGAFVTLAGALWVVQKVNLDVTQILLFLGTTVAMIVLMAAIDKFSKQIMKGAGVSIVIAIGIASLAGAIRILNEMNLNPTQVIYFLTTVGAIAIGTYFIGMFASTIVKGAGVLLVLSFGISLISNSVVKIANITPNWEAMGYFFAMLVGSATVAGLVSLLAVPIAIGAGVLVALGVSLLLVGVSFNIIANLNIPQSGIENFNYVVREICIGLAKNFVYILIAIPSAAMMIVVGLSTMIVAAALLIISELKINKENIDTFGSVMVSLVESYNKLGLVSTGKAAIKAAMLIPISWATLITAVAIKAISVLDVNPRAMDNFSVLLDNFLQTTTAAINKSLPALKAIEPGLDALTKLVSAAAGLVDVVQAYADLKIGVWKYNKQTGKMEIVEYKEIDDKMLKSVGTGIGTVLQALLEPLTIVSSDNDVWDFGNGVTVENPFKGGWFGTDNNSGTKRIEKIGNAFGTLLESMKLISDNKVLTGYYSQWFRLKYILKDYLATMITCINMVKPVETDGIVNISKNISGFMTNMANAMKAGSLPIEKLQKGQSSVSEKMRQLLNDLSDTNEWRTINNNLKTTQANINQVVRSINSINIEKATALERNLRLFTEARTVEGIKECIEYLKQLIGLIVEQQEKQTEAQNNMSNTLGSWFGNNNENNQNAVTQKQPNTANMTPAQKQDYAIQQIQSLMMQLSSKLGDTNKTYRVRVVNAADFPNHR